MGDEEQRGGTFHPLDGGSCRYAAQSVGVTLAMCLVADQQRTSGVSGAPYLDARSDHVY